MALNVRVKERENSGKKGRIGSIFKDTSSSSIKGLFSKEPSHDLKDTIKRPLTGIPLLSESFSLLLLIRCKTVSFFSFIQISRPGVSLNRTFKKLHCELPFPCSCTCTPLHRQADQNQIWRKRRFCHFNVSEFKYILIQKPSLSEHCLSYNLLVLRTFGPALSLVLANDAFFSLLVPHSWLLKLGY